MRGAVERRVVSRPRPPPRAHPWVPVDRLGRVRSCAKRQWFSHQGAGTLSRSPTWSTYLLVS